MQDQDPKFHGLLEAAPDAIVAVDENGRIVLVNRQTEALFGYERDEILGEAVEVLVPDAVTATHPAHRAAYFAHPVTRPMGAGKELAGRRKDGTEFPAEISLSAIDTDEGRLVAAAIRDVTERKRAEAKFRGVLESAPDAMVGVDEGGQIVLVNRQTEALFGYGREELLGQRVEILVPDSARSVHPSRRGAYFDHPVTRPMGAGMELAGRRKDGSEFPAEISLSAIDSEDGLLVLAAVRDVTAARQAAIVASSSDAIIAQDLAGSVISWNPAAERLFGFREAEIVGLPAMTLVPRDRHEAERDRIRRAAAREVVSEYETVRVRSDGSLVDVANSISAIVDASGAVAGVSTISRDISERKKAEAERAALEERLHQSQRLESLGQLAGGVAHDFNNLLSVILNYAAFVGEAVSDDHALHADVDEIRTAAERAARLTNQLLIFARRETIEPEQLDLRAILRDVENLLSRTLGEHVELAMALAPDPLIVVADRGQIEQVLLNLAVNARDAMPLGGTLTIEARPAEVGGEFAATDPELRPGKYIQVAVSDTGAGMPQEVAQRAFEPFFTTKPKGEGTGLGLATVYGVITEAGGSVTLYSELGLGTTVNVYLPRSSDGQPGSVTRARADQAPGRGEVVLVVEDEEAIRRLAVRILTRNGYRVLDAPSATAAIELAGREPIDLLLTDVVMPRMSGPELAAQVRAILPDLPVLYMSGYSRGVLEPQGAVESGVGLVQKPFTEAILVERVASALAEQPPRRP